MTAIHKPKAPVEQFLDRDQSILEFNRRVLSWARRDDVPALERLRYVCIVSANLDEFFEVRAAQHLVAVGAQDNTGAYSVESFTKLANAAHALVDDQYKVFNDAVTPALEAHGVHVVSHGHRSERQRKWVKDYFEREVLPLLMPVGLDPAHPFPLVANKSLNFIVRLVGKDAFGRSNEIAIMKVPRVLPRLIRMPSLRGNGDTSLVSLSSVIRSHLVDLFPGRLVSEFSQFRVTRHSDLAVDEEDVRNLRTALRLGLQQRHYGQAVRLEVSSGCSHFLSEFLTAQFNLPPGAVYRVQGPVNLVRFNQLLDLVDKPDLLFPPYRPIAPLELVQHVSIFSQMRERDILIHQPFESFDGVMAFLREAVHDPQVLTIRQTIYRTGAQSEMMDLLGEAVRLGKEVTVIVELKARFDEEANINWAETLEALGAQVVYGVVGLKTHAKMLLVTRREGKALRRYGHLSTGNYNPRTAKLYTDLSYLTVNPEITADMQAVFVHMAGQSKLPKLKRLWLAPFDLHKNLIDKIDSVAQAGTHKDRRIIAKMNALTDEALMLALLRAARLGVKIDLVVRGACTLPLTDPLVRANVVVRSVIGRFLEHSRIFYFRVGGLEEVYLSSADWMNRNMLRRIEIAWPVVDAKLRQRVIDECLVPYLNDTADAWFMQPDGTYKQVGEAGSLSAQTELVIRHTQMVPTNKDRSMAKGM
jgi:polyphosphate kinase